VRSPSKDLWNLSVQKIPTRLLLILHKVVLLQYTNATENELGSKDDNEQLTARQLCFS
jgi:hypothetical protein